MVLSPYHYKLYGEEKKRCMDEFPLYGLEKHLENKQMSIPTVLGLAKQNQQVFMTQQNQMHEISSDGEVSEEKVETSLAVEMKRVTKLLHALKHEPHRLL
jgi:hypothetical protein